MCREVAKSKGRKCVFVRGTRSGDTESPRRCDYGRVKHTQSHIKHYPNVVHPLSLCGAFTLSILIVSLHFQDSSYETKLIGNMHASRSRRESHEFTCDTNFPLDTMKRLKQKKILASTESIKRSREKSKMTLKFPTLKCNEKYFFLTELRGFKKILNLRS